MFIVVLRPMADNMQIQSYVKIRDQKQSNIELLLHVNINFSRANVRLDSIVREKLPLTITNEEYLFFV